MPKGDSFLLSILLLLQCYMIFLPRGMVRLQTSCNQRLPKSLVYCKAIVLLLGGHSGSGVHPVVLHLVDGAIDKAPLSGGRVVGVEQHVEPRPAVAHQQPVHLRRRTFPRSQELNFAILNRGCLEIVVWMNGSESKSFLATY